MLKLERKKREEIERKEMEEDRKEGENRLIIKNMKRKTGERVLKMRKEFIGAEKWIHTFNSSFNVSTHLNQITIHNSVTKPSLLL